MRSKLTEGVRVTAKPRYLQKESVPAMNQFVFAYEITVENENPEPVQLLHRHWIITDALGRTDEVKGPGVVGKQPRLGPGESFTYESYCPLQTSFGNMKGTYRMMRDNGAIFDVEVPLFHLVQSGDV